MKLLHTGDWHIGKLVHGLHMTEDQRYILKHFIDLVKEEEVDVVMIAGDVYDRSVPPTEAVELLDEVLSTLIVTLGVKVIVISGNHDSPDRLDFGSKILRDQGLFIRGRLEKTIQPIVLEDDYGEVAFYPIPFVEPALVRGLTDDDAIKTHDEAMEKVLSDFVGDIDAGIRNVCISHAFVMGDTIPESSDSERPLALGGAAYVRASHYDSFDYTALGHIHRPQRISKETIRYAGSLLKYSFSEAQQKKSMTLIELKEKGNIEIEQKYLTPKRDMRVIKGKIDDLITPNVYELANPNDYIHAIITDVGALYEPMKKLRTIYPNILLLERERQLVSQETSTLTIEDLKQKSDDHLFGAFYEYVTGSVPDDEMTDVFKTIYHKVNHEKGGAK
jgi:exonuclease SbcD